MVPADEAGWDDLQMVLGTRGPASYCQCQRYRLHPREFFDGFPVEERAERLRAQTGCGDRDSGTTSGLVAYLDHEPVGWCAVAPRASYEGLVRNRVPWVGREEDKADAGVWAVTCFVTRIGHRRHGVSQALACAAVGHARDRGARSIEGYPMTMTSPMLSEFHVGTENLLARAGFTVVSRPTVRRAVMRLDLAR